MNNERCPVCKEYYIVNSSDFKRRCRCDEPEAYDSIRKAFELAKEDNDMNERI